VSQLYELHIYTMGDKGYAGLMADTLDPEHRLFVGRVISSVSQQGDQPGGRTDAALAVWLCPGGMASRACTSYDLDIFWHYLGPWPC